jgi:hypothetical protein
MSNLIAVAEYRRMPSRCWFSDKAASCIMFRIPVSLSDDGVRLEIDVNI